MTLKDNEKFEKMNALIINVYGCTADGTHIWPRRMSKRRDTGTINLLMLKTGDNYLYVLIKNLNRLLGSGGSGTHPKELCPYCF